MKNENEERTSFTEEELHRAADQVWDSLLRVTEETDGEEEEETFSPAFQRNMERTFRRTALERRLRQAGRWAAVLLVCLGVLGTVFFATNPTALAAVLRWFRTEQQGGVTYEFAGPESDRPLPRFRPAWVPDGLTETSEQFFPGPEMPVMHSVTYTAPGDPNRGFILSYWYMQDGMQLKIDGQTPRFTREFVTVRGMYGELTVTDEPEGMNNLIWIDEAGGVAFSIDATLDRDTLLRLAESVRPAS